MKGGEGGEEWNKKQRTEMEAGEHSGGEKEGTEKERVEWTEFRNFQAGRGRDDQREKERQGKEGREAGKSGTGGHSRGFEVFVRVLFGGVWAVSLG